MSEARPVARVVSLDVFRGLTMAVMIFVNDLDEIKGLPWWTHHAPAKADVMTYVDMVFPAFLFILGMAVPLAMDARLKKGAGVLGHVLMRSLGLLVLGLVLANAGRGDANLMHLGRYLWVLLALAGAMGFWFAAPRGNQDALWAKVVRFGGLALLVGMLAIFRRGTKDGGVAWLSFSYPEIMGLLGFAYLSVSAMYLMTRRWMWAPAVWFAALMAWCAVTAAKWVVIPHWVTLYVWPVGTGASAGIAMAGVVLSVIFFRETRWVAFRQKAMAALVFAALVLLAARLLTPLGISKIRGTPAWCLYSVGASVLLFTLLYWICDVRQWSAWAAIVKPAGSNTLLTYLLPDLFYFAVAALGSTWFLTHWSYGAAGVVRSVVFTLVMLAVAAGLTRMRVRLQL